MTGSRALSVTAWTACFALALLTGALAGAPTASVERAVDDPVVGIPAPLPRLDPAIASDGTGYLAVWQDMRSSPTGDIYATRLDAAGTILDPAGFPITSAGTRYPASHRDTPAIAFDGTTFLVVWSEVRNGEPEQIYGARVSPGGIVLDPYPASLVIAAGSTVAHEAPRIAFDGASFTVVWNERAIGVATPSAVRGAHVGPSGAVLDATPFDVSGSTASVSPAAIACDATNCMIGWCSAGTTSVARVSRLGVVLDPGGASVLGARCLYGPTLAYDGTNYLASWAQSSTGTFGDASVPGGSLTAAIVAPDTSTKTVLGVASLVKMEANPSVAFDGTRHVLTWNDATGTIWGAAITTDGKLQGSPFSIAFLPKALFADAEVACRSGACFAAWEQDQGKAIHGAKVEPSATRIVVSTASNDERGARMAYAGASGLVAWTDRRTGSLQAFAARVTPAGTLDPSAIPLSSSSDDCIVADVATDGTSYLVVYDDLTSSTVYGVRVSPAGVVLDASPLTIAGNGYAGRVTFGGGSYFVAWMSFSNPRHVYGTRVSPAGTVLDPGGIPISTVNARKNNPAIAFGGDQFLVVWEDERLQPLHQDVFGTRVALDGGVIDYPAIPITTAAIDQTSPAVASNGTGFFVVWEDSRNDPGGGDVYGARVGSDGTVLDPNGLAFAVDTPPQHHPAIAYSAEAQRYVIAWEDFRSGSSFDLYARYATGAAGIAGPAFALAASASDEAFPTLAPEHASRAVVAYERFDPAAPFGVSRVRYRTFDDADAAPDAAAPIDASADGAPSDGAVSDGAASADGASSDTGAPRADATSDAESAPAGEPSSDGCSCRTSGAARAAPSPAIAMLACAARARRRRRGRSAAAT